MQTLKFPLALGLILCVFIGNTLPAVAQSDEPVASSSSVLYKLTPGVVHDDAGTFDPPDFSHLNGNRGFIWQAQNVHGSFDHLCLYLGSLGQAIDIADATVSVYSRGTGAFPIGGTTTLLATSQDTDFTVAQIGDALASPTQMQPYCFSFDKPLMVTNGEVYAFAFDLRSTSLDGRILNGSGYSSYEVTRQVNSNAIDNTAHWVGRATPFTLRTGPSPDQPPSETEHVPTGPPSVLFLPGLQASRLYEETLVGENRRWELTLGASQSDAQALYLNPDGSSDRRMYTKDNAVIEGIDIPFLGTDIYRSFFTELDRLKQEEAIYDYAVFPYDWRMDPIDIVELGTQYDDGVRYVSEALEELALASPSRKVTIVGHSNGGLVAKALMRRLEREGSADLVDSVILVGAPQLGTPAALASLLHGDFGTLTSFGGLYLNKRNARGLAEYLPAAYALLPSSAYFDRVSTPVVDLSNAPELRGDAQLNSMVISSGSSFETFLTKWRSVPEPKDLATPNLLSSFLFSRAKTTHELLDEWAPPYGVRVVQIAGWGLDTVGKLLYLEKPPTCVLIFCDSDTLSHRAVMTLDGDGTVVSPSAVANPGWETYYLDLYAANNNDDWHRHANLLESPPFQSLFEELLATTTLTTLPSFVTTEVPEPDPADTRLRIRVSAPASVSAYDAQGHRTGRIASVNQENETVTDAAATEIPNSYYFEFGEEAYLGFPADDVTVEFIAHASGTMTYTMESVSGNTSETLTSSAIPLTASTTATLHIEGGALASTTLIVDSPGDGASDQIVPSDESSETPSEPEDEEVPATKKKSSASPRRSIAPLASLYVDNLSSAASTSAHVIASATRSVMGRGEQLQMLRTYLLSLHGYLGFVTLLPSQAKEIADLLVQLRLWLR